MPRPKRKTGSPTFVYRGHSLSDETKQELIAFLGFDPYLPDHLARSTQAMNYVELLLGAYPGTVKALDKAPRAADYRATLTPLMKQAFALVHKLYALNQWESDILESYGVKLDDLELALAGLFDVSRKVLATMEGESRGQPKNTALMTLVGQLRKVFAKHYQGSEETRSQKGAAESLSQKENDEIDFIKTALTDAGIKHPKNLRRLFDGMKEPAPKHATT